MKKILNKNDFLKDLQEKWNIKDNMILEEVKKDFGDEVEKYGAEHYIKLKQALIMKIRTLDSEKKKAYIQCKKLDYEALDNSEVIDYIISIMTGGLLVSFFDKTIIESNGPILTNIQCKKLDYEALDNSEVIDYIISIMTGGLLVSFFDKTIIESNGPILTSILFSILVILIMIKVFLITTKRYKFVLSILEDIESNM